MPRSPRSLFLLLALGFLGCTSPESPKPVATSTAVAPAAVGTPGAMATPAPVASDAAAATDDDEPLFKFAEEPDDPNEFEIDADATAYYFPVGSGVSFKAKALNGKPPFKFEWHVGKDGAVAATGEDFDHVFKDLGRIDVFCVGEDATGAKSSVNLVLLSVTADEYGRQDGLKFDPEDPPSAPGAPGK